MALKSQKIVDNILATMMYADKLKAEIRHAWTSTGREESVAEHSWALSFLVILCEKFLEKPVNLEKCLIMAIVHDLAEAITGDTPYFLLESRDKKMKNETEAMNTIISVLGKSFNKNFLSVWEEYNEGITDEAKFVKALDKIEAQLQRNQSSISTWNQNEITDSQSRLNDFCDYDVFLNYLRIAVQAESNLKINNEKISTVSNSDLEKSIIT